MATQLQFGGQEYSVCGQLEKAGPWDMADEKTGEQRSGFSCSLAILGLTVKATLEGESYAVLKPLIGQPVQLTGVPTVDFKSKTVKMRRVDRILHNGQVVFERRAANDPAAAVAPEAASAARENAGGIFGRRAPARAAA